MGNLVVQGKLEQGQIRIGDGLLIQPSNRQVEIVSIESDSQKFESAEAGDKINVAIRGINNTIIKPGYCLCSRNKPIHTTDYFEAQFMIRECKNVNSAGFHCVVHVHAAQEEAIITKILSIVEKQKQRTLKSPLFVKVGQTVICRFRLANEICLEPYK
ncbi:MAG: putative eukaryotic polypeptide chain release factor 3, partial [Streblomastix strix]